MAHVLRGLLKRLEKQISEKTSNFLQPRPVVEMDSLDSVEVISDLEDHFNVSIPNQEVLQIKTIEEAVNSLSKLVNA